MDKKENSQKRTFADRFNIATGIEQAKEKFVNRVDNEIIQAFLQSAVIDYGGLPNLISRTIANHLGVRDEYDKRASIGTRARYYIDDDFVNCLIVIEGIYDALKLYKYHTATMSQWQSELTRILSDIISMSETDLGIYWEDGEFHMTGAKLMDEALVNELLTWLKDPKYINVSTPFQKGLGLYSESIKRPELLSDVVTDLYEALEALAKIVTGKATKDLSANSEKFISELNLNTYYKNMLKEYIEYANEFRHGADPTQKKPVLKQKEVEAFIYLTGIFIRLAVTEEPAHSLLNTLSDDKSTGLQVESNTKRSSFALGHNRRKFTPAMGMESD